MLNNIYFVSLQRRCSKASDEAAALYNAETPENQRTGHGVWGQMDKAIQREIKKIRGKYFDKMLAVANPNLGKAFELEVHLTIYFVLP